MVYFLVLCCLSQLIGFLALADGNFSPRSTDVPLYLITPTVNSDNQLEHLSRVAQLFSSIPNTVWIIVEDADHIRDQVLDTLTKVYDSGRRQFFSNNAAISNQDEGIYFPTFYYLSLDESQRQRSKLATKLNSCRGFVGRNVGMDLVHQGIASGSWKDGVIYFADDDNTYTYELFHELRKVSKVGLTIVGNLHGYIESAMRDKDNEVYDIFDEYS